MNRKKKNEITHGIFLAQHDTEKVWGWGSPAGQIRARRRAEWIIRNAGLKSGLRVLEIGCGTGLFTEMFAVTGARLVAVDLSPALLNKARRRNYLNSKVTFIEGRFEDHDIGGPFDAVIGSSVLHHLEIQPALSRIYDLLKPGGIMCFAEPNLLNPQILFSFKLRFLFPYISPDENPFSRWGIKTKLLNAGFVEPKVIPRDWLHPAIPPQFIKIFLNFCTVLERIPFIKEFAGSLYIKCNKP